MAYLVGEIQQLLSTRLIGAKDKPVRHLAFDTRNMFATHDSMFVCIVGERHNGHHYIANAYQKGIRIFLISEITDEINNIPGSSVLIVNNTLTALHNIAVHWRKKFQVPVVGITGSNGKTIIKEWLAHGIGNELHITRSPNSYNSQLGVPLSVWLLNEKTEMAIFEAGISKPNEMEGLELIIKPTHGIFTNIGPAHQENFGSTESKIQEKLKLFVNCDFLFYCYDHELVHKSIQENIFLADCQKICWSRQNRKVFCYIEKIETTAGHSKISVIAKQNEVYDFTVPVSDKAGIENACHVISFLLFESFNTDRVARQLGKLPNIAMRLEQMQGRNNCIVLNDAYNSDLNALQIAIEHLLSIPKDNYVVIVSDIPQTGMDKKKLYGEVNQLLQQANIKHLVGIGAEILQNRNAFDIETAHFFKTTADFINHFGQFNFTNAAILVKGAREFKFEQVVALLEEKQHETKLEIHFENLIFNLNYFRSLLLPGTKIMVMVKALSYGSGSKEIAQVLQNQKVDYLGVAFTDEGRDLRNEGVQLPIMVLSPSESNFREIIENKLEPEIYNPEILRSFIQFANTNHLTAYPVHIKLDTGMHRLGFDEHEMQALLEVLANNNSIYIKSVLSHLAASDDPKNDSFTLKQIERFNKGYLQIEKVLGYQPMRQIVNSAGIERFPEAHYSMVRLGIGLHGISRNKAKLKSVTRLVTSISQIKQVRKGESIGYNRSGKANQPKTIAILPIGYADGLNRKFGNGIGTVVINGARYPYIGNICMDMCMVDISDAKDMQVGDEVVIFGPEKPIDKLASEIGTIPYEILTSVSQRVKRIYFHA